MKDLIEPFKNLNASHWMNLILAGLLWFAYTSNESRIADLEKTVAKEQLASKAVFKLYQDCINKKK